jgi:hypothetical protein
VAIWEACVILAKASDGRKTAGSDFTELDTTDDIVSVQKYHETHQSLGEETSDSCRACKATQEYNEYAPISEIDDADQR